MSLDSRLKALESDVKLTRQGKTYDMSMLSLEQLKLIERAAKNGADMNGTTYLDVSEFTEHEVAELEKALWLTGVLPKGKQFQ